MSDYGSDSDSNNGSDEPCDCGCGGGGGFCLCKTDPSMLKYVILGLYKFPPEIADILRDNLCYSTVFAEAVRRISFPETEGGSKELSILVPCAMGHKTTWKTVIKEVCNSEVCSCSNSSYNIQTDGFWEFEELVVAAVNDVLQKFKLPIVFPISWCASKVCVDNVKLRYGEELGILITKYYHCSSEEMYKFMRATEADSNDCVDFLKLARDNPIKYMTSPQDSYLNAHRELRRAALGDMIVSIEGQN